MAKKRIRKCKAVKVAIIPADVWKNQIASRDDVWLDFMAIQIAKSGSVEELQAEIKRLCEKHSITGIEFKHK